MPQLTMAVREQPPRMVRIDLPIHLRLAARRYVKEGAYDSLDELVCDALRVRIPRQIMLETLDEAAVQQEQQHAD